MRVCLAVAVLVSAFAAVGSHRASAATVAAQGDFAGLVDLGHGRRIYLECRGWGSPTVVLEAGYRSSVGHPDGGVTRGSTTGWSALRTAKKASPVPPSPLPINAQTAPEHT